jgi:hypothetical protein
MIGQVLSGQVSGGHIREGIVHTDDPAGWATPQDHRPLLIDNVFGSLGQEFRQFLCVAIYVATPLSRGRTRDIAMGTKEEVAGRWTGCVDDQLGYMARQSREQFADMAVDGAAPFGGRSINEDVPST